MDEPSKWPEILSDVFAVRVTPKASRNAVKLEYDENHNAYLRVYVTSVPEKGKANQAVIKLLAKQMKIPKSKLVLLKGETNSQKLFQILK